MYIESNPMDMLNNNLDDEMNKRLDATHSTKEVRRVFFKMRKHKVGDYQGFLFRTYWDIVSDGVVNFVR